MSHFSCIVFSDTPDGFRELLEPFSETDERYFETFEIDPDRYAELENMYKKHFGGTDMTFEQFVEDEGYFKVGNKFYERYNPNAIWDYYTLDGREADFSDCVKNWDAEDLRLQDCNFDYDSDSETVKDLKKRWAVIKSIALHEPGAPEETMTATGSLFKASYLYDRYKTEEQYIREMTDNIPYCFITPDGELHSPGTVGWFGCDDATADSYNRYRKEWEEYIHSGVNPYINFVDCHI